jgi:HEAT repeat protein
MASDSNDDDLVRPDRSVEDCISKLEQPDPMQRLQAVHALAQLGPRAAGVTDALIAVLREDMMVRTGAAATLGEFGNEAGESAIFGLAETLRDPEERVRVAAAEALVAIGPEYLDSWAI